MKTVSSSRTGATVLLIFAGVLLGLVAFSSSSSRADAGTAVVNSRVFLPFLFNETYSPPISSIFGAQFYNELDSPSAGMSLVPTAHVYWARWPVMWSVVEPVNTTPDKYNWSAIDGSLQAAKRVGLHLVATVMQNPSWAATYSNGPIDKVDISEFAEFMGALAARYNGSVQGLPAIDYWEMGNEPDAGDPVAAAKGASYWGPFGADYAKMLCAVYPKIKAAAPNARVSVGGLAYDSFQDQGGPFVRGFIDDVIKAGGAACFDALSFHYYPPFALRWAAYGPGLSGKANYLRAKLQSYGIDKPLIDTESGWHSNNFYNMPSTPEMQCRYVVELFVQALASHLDLMTWFTWKDPPDNGASGLIDLSNEAKTSYNTYRVAVEKLSWAAATFQRSLSPSELGSAAYEGYLFFKPGQKALYVLWSNDGTTGTVKLPLPAAKVTDMYGASAMLNGSGGSLSVSVGPNPIYVEVP